MTYKLEFAGCGGAFADKTQYQSNLLLTSEDDVPRRMMLDCGSDARFSFGELGATNKNLHEWLDAVYISHLHADHAGGLEFVGFCTYFGSKGEKRPKLFIQQTLIEPLWQMLRPGMENLQGKRATLETYFDVRPVEEEERFWWEGVRFEPVKVSHVSGPEMTLYSYGLEMLFGATERVYWTSDMEFNTSEEIIDRYFKATLILQDCETVYRSGVHAHYEQLLTLPEEIRRKMFLYHYAPGHKHFASRDGFGGFVSKGTVFYPS